MSEWFKCRNLLCVRLDQMGDVLMTTPAIKAVKDTIPDCRITLLSSPAGESIAPLIPCIDEFIVYEAPWMKASAVKGGSQEDRHFIEELGQQHFDGAIIFNVFSQNPLPAAFLVFLAGIPLRLGYCRENPYQLLTHWFKDLEVIHPFRHEVQRQLDLVAQIGCFNRDPKLMIEVPPEVQVEVERILKELVRADFSKPVIVIHPGCTALSRRYPAEKFAQAIKHLSQQIDAIYILTGNEQEKELIARIQKDIPAVTYSLAGALNVKELCALISMAEILITNNTGPAHIAAAVGTPVVDLYALTNPQHTPWRVAQRVLNHDVPCKFCYKSICPYGHQDCLNKVEPQTVAEAALELLKPRLWRDRESICTP